MEEKLNSQFKRPFTLYSRKRKSEKPLFYARFRNQDNSWTSGRNTGQTSRAAAEGWCIQYLNNGQVVEKENVTLAGFATGFFDWSGEWAIDFKITGKRLSERQCKEKTAILENRILPKLGSLRLTDITKGTVKEFRNGLFSEGLSGSSINKTLSCLRAILEATEDKRLIQAVPKIERAAMKARERGILTPDEVKALFSSPWPDTRSYVGNLTAAVTGLRKSELLALQIHSIHAGYLDIQRSWETRMRQLNPTTKTGRSRYLPIPGKVEDALRLLIAENPYQGKSGENAFIFYSTTMPDKPMEGRLLTEALYEAMRGIGINSTERKARNVDFHSWRHWLNSILVNARIPLQKIQSMTGHLTDEMTATYYHADDMADVRQIQETIF